VGPTAVDFDDQGDLVAVEVGDERTDRVLAAEAEAGLPAPKALPEDDLGEGQALAVVLGEAR